MNAKYKQPIPEAIMKRWWWRRLVFVEYDEQTHTTKQNRYVKEYPAYGFSGEWFMWSRKDEIVAFRFELLRRLHFPNLPEWPHMPNWLMAWITPVLEPQKVRTVAGIF